MKNINADIKARQFKRAYLLFGEEAFLVSSYEGRLREAVVPKGMEAMNYDRFEGKDFQPQSIIDASETLPLMNDYRLVVVRDSGLFDAGRKDATDAIADYIAEIPDSTVIVFSESKADKRNRLYKKVSESGYAAEFKTPPEPELTDWVVKLFKKGGKDISKGSAVYLLRTVAHDMSSVYTETQKLMAYKGQDTEITAADIDAICTKSPETKIFDLTDAIGNKKADVALDIYSNMLLMKESPIMILTMIARQFRLVLQCGFLAQEMHSNAEIAARLGLRGFVVGECVRQSRNFKTDDLIQALNDCLETDVNIKTGIIGDRLGVETLIIKYCLLCKR